MGEQIFTRQKPGRPAPELNPGVQKPEITQPADPYRQGVTPEIPAYHNVEIPQRVPDNGGSGGK